MPTFGAVLRRFRLAAGLTQETLAERAQLSTTAISALERGVRQAPYDETVRLLADALALGPEARTALTAAARRPRSATRETGRPLPTGPLPAPLTSFVGRDRELAAIGLLLAEGKRLVTLTGPGGVGKTRLALEAARRIAPTFPNGVWLVDLAPLADAALVPQAVATVLGVHEAPGRDLTQRLIAALRDRAGLLVLDNCEHLLAACGRLLAAVLPACPRVAVLATSREPLHVQGEQHYPLLPLPVPQADFLLDPSVTTTLPAAVQLFIERARAVRPDFAPTTEGLVATGTLCRQLDGLPLAIELMAPQVHVLSPEQILSRLPSRMQGIVAVARDTEPRHRTLRALMDWSFDLLAAPEQALLQRLAVFVGGCDLDAVESVCTDDDLQRQDVLELLTALLDKSLVIVEVQPAAARYRLLESIREYAAEKLASAGDATALRARHAAYFLHLARTARRHLTGPAQPESVRRLELEHHNLRAALGWALAGADAATALRMCAALAMFWYLKGYYREGRDWIARALLAGPEAVPRARATALHGAASLAAVQHDHDDALRLIAESVAVWRTVGDPRGLAASLAELGMHARHQGDLAGARQACEEALAIYAESPDPWGQRLALGVLGWVAEAEGDHAEARHLLEESLAAARAAQSPLDVALQLNNLGILALRRGDLREAERYYREALLLAADVDAYEPLACTLEGLASLVAGAQPGQAAWLAGAAAAVRAAIGAPRIAQFEEEYRRLDSVLHAMLSERELVEATTAGAAVPLPEVIGEVLSGLNGGIGGAWHRPNAARTE
jgi:non-specific serine/threonine protein kinase